MAIPRTFGKDAEKETQFNWQVPMLGWDTAIGAAGGWRPIAIDANGAIRTQTGEYETVAASQTDQVLGATGAAGDVLERLVCVVTTAATAQVQIKDGAGSAITVLPNSPGGGVGTYTIDLQARSTAGAWKVTTGAGVAVIAIGNFT